MDLLADSNAVLNRERQFTQHQALLTLLQNALADPDVKEFHWLDLACGKGQSLAHIKQNIPETARYKVRYFGYDLIAENLKSAIRLAEDSNFLSVDGVVGPVEEFSERIKTKGTFDFITLTNATHELRPRHLGDVITQCIERLSNGGHLFSYDMETLPEAELGAITWSSEQIARILSDGIAALRVEDYQPAVGTWTHASCNGWNLTMQRSHLHISEAEFAARRAAFLNAVKESIHQQLEGKLTSTRTGLRTFQQFGMATKQEENERLSMLYDYWALTNELESWS